MIVSIFWIIAALSGLWIGTRLTVSSAVNISRHFGVSELFIGLTVISIGTDLPELAVTISASLKSIAGEETSGVLIGNALGSCLGQAGLVLGISALFQKILLARQRAFRDSMFLLGATAMLFIFSLDGEIIWYEGIVCILAYMGYFYLLLSQEHSQEKSEKIKSKSFLKVILMLIAGLLIIIVSSEVAISNSIELAGYLDIPQSIIGIFILGLGTSLPELAVAVSATTKSIELSVGTIIGSTILDILLPAGIGSIFAPLTVDHDLLFIDLPALFLLSALISLFLLTKRGIQKQEAVALLLFYLGYMLVRLISQ